MLKSANRANLTPAMSRVAQGRGAILTVFILSVVNMFAIIFGNSYFLFSAYIPQIVATVGLDLYAETPVTTVLVVTLIIGIVISLPYLFFWIFSKKSKGTMIAALVLFCIDSAVFLWDFVQMILLGYFTGILDLVIRVLALVEMALAVKFYTQAKIDAEALAAPAVPETETETVPVENQGPDM